MKIALTLLLLQGLMGAFDTLWFHEWVLRLPALPTARWELRLHACRDFAYAAVFGMLAWRIWFGAMALLLALVLLAEIGITLWDFVEEDRTRKLPPGERVMHTLMSIVYGAFLANLLPVLLAWWQQPTGFSPVAYGWISWGLTFFAVGVFLSGVRDLVASAKRGS